MLGTQQWIEPCFHRTYILTEKKKKEKMSLYMMLGSDKGYLENKEGEKD